jgi:hypothetical protein
MAGLPNEGWEEGGSLMSAVIRYRATFPDSPTHFLDYTGFGESEVRAKVSKLYPGGEYRIEQVI